MAWHKEIKLTQQQHNVLIGSLLGDGGFNYISGRSATFRILRAQKDIAYLQWELDIFKNFIKNNVPTLRSYTDNRTDKTYYSCYFETIANPTFLSYAKDWYQPKKIVPNNLVLNSEIIAIWICDDAYIRTEKQSYRLKITISTDGFARDECQFLADLLSDRYNEYFYVCHHSNNQYVIKGSDSATRELIKDIDPVFPISMKRKMIWKDPATRFYNNIPEKALNGKILAEKLEKKNYKIAEFIINHNLFTAKELAKYIGYEIVRRGNYESGIRTYELLDDFVDKNFLIKDISKKVRIYSLTPLGTQHFQNELRRIKSI
jgi:hypothetical protein